MFRRLVRLVLLFALGCGAPIAEDPDAGNTPADAGISDPDGGNDVGQPGDHVCVGNLHEWGADPPDGSGRGRFRGGFYGDAELNGPGCRYVNSAHGVTYHDYSTGFRCCADAGS